jgi:predicted DNA-binding transcriptional regulator AlpA
MNDGNERRQFHGQKTMLEPSDPLELIRDPAVAKLLNVSLRSIARWDKDPEDDFPEPIVINGRKYRRRAKLEEWMRKRALTSLQTRQVAKVTLAGQAKSAQAKKPAK